MRQSASGWRKVEAMGRIDASRAIGAVRPGDDSSAGLSTPVD
jgi:hypothetical protein